ncbi:MAG: thiamine-phosphate kinase, partial [Pseudomonadota bacterium]
LGHTLGGDDASFLSGLREVLAVYDVPLLGGDTISSTSASTFSLTAIGRATHTPVPSRKGARVGDAIFVTGTLGCAMLGFEGKEKYLEAFNRPTPLLDEGRLLAPHVSSMMDVSDGLLLDAWRLANANAVTIQLDPEAIPVADPNRLHDCVRWGDDYELLFTAPADAEPPVSATRIGTVNEATDAPVMFGDEALRSPDSLGYRHG